VHENSAATPTPSPDFHCSVNYQHARISNGYHISTVSLPPTSINVTLLYPLVHETQLDNNKNFLRQICPKFILTQEFPRHVSGSHLAINLPINYQLSIYKLRSQALTTAGLGGSLLPPGSAGVACAGAQGVAAEALGDHRLACLLHVRHLSF
jgi:hypothetical protein